MLIPVVIAMAIGSPTAGRILDKFGSKVVLITGTSLLAAGMFGLTFESMSIILLFIFQHPLSALEWDFLWALHFVISYLEKQNSTSERGSAQGMLTIFTGMGQLLAVSLSGLWQVPGVEE